ncbi:MAG: 6-phosphogluconolactonase [Terriglobales bacterium]
MYELRIADADAFGPAAADLMAALPAGACFGLPTGHTPLPLYAELRRRGFAGWRAVMLDEYLGDPRFQAWLRAEIIDPLRIPGECFLRMPASGTPADCDEFEHDLRAWDGCDLQFLGLGANGHIGFNEPGSPRDSRTRVVTLTAATARANAEYRPDAHMPAQAVTQGIATILEARRHCLLVRGAAKAAVLAAALRGPVTPALPASFLQLSPALTVIADPAAAQLLADR